MWLASDQDISAIHEARDGHQAVAAIRKVHPDLVFLDIQMPGMNGFDVLRALPPDAIPLTVFVTGYDTYAVAAFEAIATTLPSSVGVEQKRAANGDYHIWLEPRFVGRLRALRGPGESYSDVILTLAASSRLSRRCGAASRRAVLASPSCPDKRRSPRDPATHNDSLSLRAAQSSASGSTHLQNRQTAC